MEMPVRPLERFGRPGPSRYPFLGGAGRPH